MTILGINGRLTALASAFLCAIFSWNANSNPAVRNNDVVMVQSPAWTTIRVQQFQPVVRAPSPQDGDASALNDLWPRLVAFSPQTEFVEPFVQSDLSLGVQYNYHFNFELSARNSAGQGLGVPDGWYQLQMAVIKKSSDSIFSATQTVENPYDRYVTSTSAIVKVSGGSFARKISLRFPVATAIALKHHLFIELIPLDNRCTTQGVAGRAIQGPCINVRSDGSADPTRSVLKPLSNFRPFLIEMPFVPLVTSGSKLSDTDDVRTEDLPYRERSLADYISRAQLELGARRASLPRTPTPEEHARNFRLHLIAPNDPQLEQVSQRWIYRSGGASVQRMLEDILRVRATGAIRPTEEFQALYPSVGSPGTELEFAL